MGPHRSIGVGSFESLDNKISSHQNKYNKMHRKNALYGVRDVTDRVVYRDSNPWKKISSIKITRCWTTLSLSVCIRVMMYICIDISGSTRVIVRPNETKTCSASSLFEKKERRGLFLKIVYCCPTHSCIQTAVFPAVDFTKLFLT